MDVALPRRVEHDDPRCCREWEAWDSHQLVGRRIRRVPAGSTVDECPPLFSFYPIECLYPDWFGDKFSRRLGFDERQIHTMKQLLRPFKVDQEIFSSVVCMALLPVGGGGTAID